MLCSVVLRLTFLMHVPLLSSAIHFSALGYTSTLDLFIAQWFSKEFTSTLTFCLLPVLWPLWIEGFLTTSQSSHWIAYMSQQFDPEFDPNFTPSDSTI